MDYIKDIKEISVGMVLMNRCRGTVTVTGISDSGWIYYTYEGLLGPDFKEKKLFGNGDKISYNDRGVVEYPFSRLPKEVNHVSSNAL